MGTRKTSGNNGKRASTDKREGYVVEAQEFRLKDKAGNVRSKLCLGDDGEPLLQFMDKSGAPRMELTMVNGLPSLSMFDKKGLSKVDLCLDERGTPRLCLDSEGSRFHVSFDEKGYSEILFEKDAIGMFDVTLGPSKASVMLMNNENTERVELWITNEADAEILLGNGTDWAELDSRRLKFGQFEGER